MRAKQICPKRLGWLYKAKVRAELQEKAVPTLHSTAKRCQILQFCTAPPHEKRNKWTVATRAWAPAGRPARCEALAVGAILCQGVCVVFCFLVGCCRLLSCWRCVCRVCCQRLTLKIPGVDRGAPLCNSCVACGVRLSPFCVCAGPLLWLLVFALCFSVCGVWSQFCMRICRIRPLRAAEPSLQIRGTMPWHP